MNRVGFGRLSLAYVRANLRAQLEYRGAFVSQVLGMFINDGMWVAFWALFFARFPVLRGWTAQDVVTLWAICAAGFGLAHAVWGNALVLPTLIMQGQLDAWLLYPRAVLPHVLLGRTSASAWGDLLFGFLAYGLLNRPDLEHLVAFALMTLAVAVLLGAVSILSGSVAFFLGSSQAISDQYRFAVMTFATYPNVLFEGWTKVLLFTLIPAGFVSQLSVDAVRHLSMVDGLLTFAGAAAVMSVAVLVFYRGLRRYESGNLALMRS